VADQRLAQGGPGSDIRGTDYVASKLPRPAARARPTRTTTATLNWPTIPALA